MKEKIFILLVILLSLPCVVFSATLEELEKRIDELEQEVVMSQDASEDIGNLVKISGYADLEYSMSNNKDATTEGKASTKNGVRLHHLSLFLKKEITERWRFSSEIEFEDAPLFEFDNKTTKKGDGKLFVEAMNVDYLWIPQANLRFGRFFTPAGIWSIDHYPPFVSTQERPLHIRKIFPQLIDGAMIYGTQGLGANFFVKYDLYAGNGDGNSGHNDDNSDKAFAGKVSLLIPALKHLEIGGTYYMDTLNSGESIRVNGFHGKVSGFGVTIQSEYADGKNSPDAGSSYNKTGYYTQIMYEWRDFGVGYRNDFYEGSSIVDNDYKLRDSFFINYHVTHEINLKLENHLTKDEIRTTEHESKTIASITISLGN